MYARVAYWPPTMKNLKLLSLFSHYSEWHSRMGRYQERDLQLGGKTDIPGCSKCLSSFIKLVFAHNLTRQLKLSDLFFWILTLGHWDLLTFIFLNQGLWSFELWHRKILSLKPLSFGPLDFLKMRPLIFFNVLYFYP